MAHERHELIIGAYDLSDVVDLVAEAGFVDVRVLGGYDGDELGPHHHFAVVEAHRPSA